MVPERRWKEAQIGEITLSPDRLARAIFHVHQTLPTQRYLPLHNVQDSLQVLLRVFIRNYGLFTVFTTCYNLLTVQNQLSEIQSPSSSSACPQNPTRLTLYQQELRVVISLIITSIFSLSWLSKRPEHHHAVSRCVTSRARAHSNSSFTYWNISRLKPFIDSI
jgi:hypothetical protein